MTTYSKEVKIPVQAAIITYRLEELSWDEISTRCLVSPQEALQLFQRAQERAGLDHEPTQSDLLILLNHLDEAPRSSPPERSLISNVQPESTEIGRATKCEVCGLPNSVDPFDWVPGQIERHHIKPVTLLKSVLQGCPFCILLSKVVSWASQSLFGEIDSITFLASPGYPVFLYLYFYMNGTYSALQMLNLYNFAELVPSTVKTLLPNNQAFRHVRNNPASPECLRLAKQWITECCNDHVMCNGAALYNPPSRILLIIDNSPGLRIRLVEHLPNLPQYVALSHSWGKEQNLTTTTQNIERMKIDIPWSTLPETYKHAITVCQALGFQYLWIDSLCILQDSKEDWETESARMSDVYYNATLVIAASSSLSDEQGFLGLRNDSLGPDDISLTTSFAIANGTNTSLVYLSPGIQHYRHYTIDEPLSRRGWAFQERLLARRFLSFNSSELHWECETTWRCECGAGDYLAEKSHRYNLHVLLDGADLFSTYQKWYHGIVGTYSSRRLTKSSDRLPAISAVARTFRSKLDDEYMAGLWKNDLENGLMWERGPHFLNTWNPLAQSSHAPSWSWASIDGPIWYPIEGPFHCMAEIIDSNCTLSTLDPTGGVKAGYVILRGSVVNAWVTFPALGYLHNARINIAKLRDDMFEDVASFTVDSLLGKSNAVRFTEKDDALGESVMRVDSDTIPTGEWLPGTLLNPKRISYTRSGGEPLVWCLYMGFEQVVQTEDERDMTTEMKSDEKYKENEEYGEVEEYEADKEFGEDEEHEADKEYGEDEEHKESEEYEESEEHEEREEYEESEVYEDEKRPHYALVLGRCVDQSSAFSRLGLMKMTDGEYSSIFQDAVDMTVTIV